MAKPTKQPRAPQAISLDALANVTGGRTSATAPGATTTPSLATATSTDPQSQMMTLLSEIASSIQTMGQQRQDPFMQAIQIFQQMNGGGTGPFGGGSGPFGGGSPFPF